MNTAINFATMPFEYETEAESDWQEAESEGAMEFNPAQFPATVLNLLGRGAEILALRAAMALGHRDANKLTDLIFFSRHPERQGKGIARNEPDFQALSREWLEIRERLVKPALQPSPGPSPHPQTGGSTTETYCQPVDCTETGSDLDRMKALVPLLNKYRGDIPLEFLLGWIVVESGGCVGVVTSICERGYFQLHPGEAKSVGAEPQRLSTDRDYSVKMGIEMVKQRMARARQLGFTPGTDLFWHVTKLLHWLPAGVDVIVRLLKAKGAWPPGSWQELSQFMQTNRTEILQVVLREQNKLGLLPKILKSRPGSEGWDPITGINNVNKLYARGHSWATLLRQAGALSELEAETEYSDGSMPRAVTTTLSRGLESAAMRLAIYFGYRDETQLTNLVFFHRHPERNGRLISKTERNYQALSREWIEIRERLVRPALSGATVPDPGGRATPPSGSTPTTGTPDIVSARGIRVARSIAPQVEALIDAAAADGVRLSGGGYRTTASQIELRKKHCGTSHYDIYEKPSSQCTPPTAPPGKSLHERGLAIDFTYNGGIIDSHRNPGYQWLAQNAARFGLKNLPSEPWHWSTTGG